MDGSFRIGRLSGIPIQIHYTFLLVIPLFAWILGSQITATIDLLKGVYAVPLDPTLITSGFIPYILVAVVAIGLFGGVLIHEIVHSVVALRNGIRIENITLMIFGGISSMEDGTPDPKVELPMALVGPLTSLGLGVVFSAMVYILPDIAPDPATAGVVVFLSAYLGLLNIILFAFNLIPAFPMDGGRVLRAFLAKRMPLHRATRIAADVGRGVAILFGIVDLIFISPFLILIALFIYIGATMEINAVKYNSLLQDLTVGDMMSSPVTTVPSNLPVSQVITMMYTSKHLGFPVVERDSLVGMITLADVNRRSSIDRESMQVRDIMTRDLITLPPTAPVIDALKIMSARNIGRIPIVSGGEVLGIVTRTDIIKITELKQI